jgi:hypothetical protein
MIDFSLNLNSIIAIVAIIAAITIAYFANWWRNQKSLSYQVIADSPLLTAEEEIREKLQILYDGKPVKNVRLFILKVINDGNQPIDETDFKKPIDFVFSDEAQILSAEIVAKNPDNLNISIGFRNNILSINPILLNNKDFIEIKSVVSTYSTNIKSDARIVNIKNVYYVDTNLAPISTLLAIFISCSGVMVIASFVFVYILDMPTWLVGIAILLTVIFLIGMMSRDKNIHIGKLVNKSNKYER